MSEESEKASSSPPPAAPASPPPNALPPDPGIDLMKSGKGDGEMEKKG